MSQQHSSTSYTQIRGPFVYSCSSSDRQNMKSAIPSAIRCKLVFVETSHGPLDAGYVWKLPVGRRGSRSRKIRDRPANIPINHRRIKDSTVTESLCDIIRQYTLFYRGPSSRRKGLVVAYGRFRSLEMLAFEEVYRRDLVMIVLMHYRQRTETDTSPDRGRVRQLTYHQDKGLPGYQALSNK